MSRLRTTCEVGVKAVSGPHALGPLRCGARPAARRRGSRLLRELLRRHDRGSGLVGVQAVVGAQEGDDRSRCVAPLEQGPRELWVVHAGLIGARRARTEGSWTI